MKILASDFDNTIYYLDDEDKNITNADAINNFVKRGNIFCIVTGRSYPDIKQLLNKYNIPYSYLICEDGAKIFNNMDYCIDTTLLNKSLVEEIIEVLKRKKLDYYLSDGYNSSFNTGDCVKIVIKSTDKEEKEKIVNMIKKDYDVHIYASRFHVNIIDKTVNKKNAIKKLFNIEKLDYDLLNVIGDNDNDFEMLQEFNGAVIKEHNPKLDVLKKEEYETISDYINYLINN